MYYEPCNTTTNIDNNMYNSTNGVDCQRHIDCESSQADQAVRNPASSTKTKPSDIQMDETDSTMNSQRDQAYILSFDGINLTQEAVQALQAENENISSDAGSDDVMIHRRLLRRRHVRKIQKERAQTNNTTAPSNNTAHPTAIFGPKHFSFLDLKLPQPPLVAPPSPPQKLVRYPCSRYKPRMSPIRPRVVLPPALAETWMMPPMSPIPTTQKLPLDSTTASLGIKRKLDSALL